MLDRRQGGRNKVIFASTAAPNERGSIPRKGRSILARMVRRQANKVGLAFRIMTSDEPASDLDERLRKSERKKRQLQRRIEELLGKG